MFCPPSWMSFQEAELQCNDYGAHLLSIHSRKENDFVHDLIGRKNRKVLYAWIGLTRDYVGANWKWTDGTEVDYLNWAYHQPDNYNDVPGFTPENCAQASVLQAKLY
ncbi:lectin C-type domain protein [Ancylostoma duodenale]|uniref:Lectin C-type domain protein n=1 Tax=Ancylostoma duodenale TaxID=51022 RepID=A0A0C2D0E1_9BILA|nr:lectin C-type domain protein [Ancylostoma duodenale]